ncbi:MAG: iron ABC transporter permease [Paenibacillus macerans]|uniref:ABC transporter permease subunit n=1 Tax=Paenibacillus macerans TaxID=44252 RepID=A0A6N8F1Z6_PAEMA|nr:iron ABC transporter permease [Paenibacillus macerans]MDU7473432.1 iron ABC transporter permease [Paenibacillus macerans]MEC0136738.1 iron ABC transporter permease [Paenibacillus macerans]MEC0332566.1 iron ABC transporter permease [Paenibacillus macerans]MUG26456.1 ABC transporter permease subunit [Paenibacillus macerans]GBK64828.1 iron ABC transporter permease [Paenibacillus macerans]
MLRQTQDRLGWSVSLILFVLVLYPLLAVFIQVLLPGVFFGNWERGELSLLLEIFRRPLWQKSLENSVVLAGGTTVLATLLGGGLAMVRSSRQFPTARLLDAAVWILLIMPSFILAQGWVMFSAGGGLAAKLLGWTWITPAVFQPAGLIAVMTLSKFPLAYLSVRSAMEWKVEQLAEAARLSGASPWRVWRTIQAPLLLPAFLAGAALVFMDTVGDFGLPASIAAVYRFPTLPYSIYSALYTSPIRFDMAGVLSFYLVLLIGAAMLVQFYALRRSRFDFLSARAVPAVPKPAGRLKWPLAALNLAFLLVVIGIPIGSNVLLSFLKTQTGGLQPGNLTLEHYRSLFHSGSELLVGLERSLAIALLAAALGLLIGLMAAYVLNYSQFRLKRGIEVLSLVTLAVPGVVLGIGYIFVWNQRWLDKIGLLLYGKPSILVLAAIAGAIPVITRVLIGAMAKVPGSLLHAAQLNGDTWLGRIRRVLAPLIHGALLSAGLAAFGSGVFDLAVNSILFPPNFTTFPVSVNKAFEDMKFGYASAATVFGGTVVVLIILLLEVLLRRKEVKS